MRKQRDVSELAGELRIQLRLLQKACHEFDSGDWDEYRNIARALRVILSADDHGNRSLVELAGEGDRLFISTVDTDHCLNLSPFLGLTGIIIGSQTIGCRAFLSDARSKILTTLTNWLDETVIDDKRGGVFNRLRLVKAVANLGGANHYPPDVREYFVRLQDISVGAIKNGIDVDVKFADFEKHALRQVAHEVICTFSPSYLKPVCCEAGALMLSAFEIILYPGRRTQFLVESKINTSSAAEFNAFEHEYNGISNPAVDLPYESTPQRAPCPCRSDLKFKDCCATPHDFSEEVLEQFEKRYLLGKYRSNQ